jgi:DNA (cytosine-5)-methyltransferase 1
MTLTVGSLFSGIGGLDLGLERAGMTVAWQAENDPYCCKVLTKHWPDVPNLGDVTTIDWSTVPRVDLICGGYPCQPFSTAGTRRGRDDPRHLWPHMRDAIRLLRPDWALLENVPGHLSLGFGDVLGDLAEIGYDAEWDCIPAAAVGAPHLRWRVFIVAYPSGRASEQDSTFISGDGVRGVSRPSSGRRSWGSGRGSGPPGHVAYPAEQPGDVRTYHPRSGSQSPRTSPDLPIFGNGPGATRSDSGRWAVESDVGRVAHGIPHRVDRLRALGNAVVPQVAQHIGQLILEAAA